MALNSENTVAENAATANAAVENPTTAPLPEPIAAWLAPIAGDNPAGVSNRFDPDYEALRAEVAKLDSPRGEKVDWPKVYRLGEALTKQGKDLVILAHTAGALMHTRGLAGLVIGMTGLTEAMTRYWEHLHPPRPRARANAVQWFLEKAVIYLETIEVRAADRAPLEALAAETQRLREILQTQLEGHAPATTHLKEVVERLLIGLPAAPKPVERHEAERQSMSPARTSPPSADAEASPRKETPVETSPHRESAIAPFENQPSGPPPLAADAAADPEALAKYLRAAGQGLIDAALALKAAEPHNPTAYRALRQGLWLHLSTAPDLGENGRTRVPGLGAGMQTKLEALARAGSHAALLDEAESLMLTNRLNLNLQRYAAQALQGLGQVALKAVVVAELAAFLARVPTLPALAAADGSPLADAQTQAWIDEEVLKTARPAAVTLRDQVEVIPAAAMAEVGAALQAGKPSEAMARLQPLADGAADGRARFLVRLAQAETCRKAGAAKAAEAIYVALDEELCRRDLASWDPALTAECLAGFLTVLRAQKGTEQLEAVVYRRLAALAPARALSFVD